jgi:hypothetical protein
VNVEKEFYGMAKKFKIPRRKESKAIVTNNSLFSFRIGTNVIPPVCRLALATEGPLLIQSVEGKEIAMIGEAAEIYRCLQNKWIRFKRVKNNLEISQTEFPHHGMNGMISVNSKLVDDIEINFPKLILQIASPSTNGDGFHFIFNNLIYSVQNSSPVQENRTSHRWQFSSLEVMDVSTEDEEPLAEIGAFSVSLTDKCLFCMGSKLRVNISDIERLSAKKKKEDSSLNNSVEWAEELGKAEILELFTMSRLSLSVYAKRLFKVLALDEVPIKLGFCSLSNIRSLKTVQDWYKEEISKQWLSLALHIDIYGRPIAVVRTLTARITDFLLFRKRR